MKDVPLHKPYIFGSLTRNAHFTDDILYRPVPHDKWKNGDFVVSEIKSIGGSTVKAELVNGRMMELMKGDHVVGALGVRHATLEATGSYKCVSNDGMMHLLTGAGLMGLMTSRSVFVTPLIQIQYKGHVQGDARHLNMRDFARKPSPAPFDMPVILIVGTSMSAGKTTSARIITRHLKEMGLTVTAAKLTGAGRFRDILTVNDAGADYVFDFVDAGLPSTICPAREYRDALKCMQDLIAGTGADVAVIEIGASPLEPYNGDIAIHAIKKNVVLTVLCASDPYSVLGVQTAYSIKPTIVSGPAVNTIGGVDLVRKVSKINALNLIDKKNWKSLRQILKQRLEIQD